MDKILTVVIPTYNMERYLRYCLDSLCVSRGGDALEVLVINDGSKDSSSAIAHEYERKYPGMFRVIDKENGNYGSCVNRGLAEAKGKYIKILDADDSFDTENFERFIDFLCNTDADLVVSDFAIVDEERTVKKTVNYCLGNGSLFCMEDICTLDYFSDMQMHAVTYRLNILLNMGYKQTEGISYTDQQWIFSPMARVKTVAFFSNQPVYMYLVGRTGQTIDPDVKIKRISERAKNVLGMAIQYEKYSQEVTAKVKTYLDARIRPNVQDIYVTCFSNRSKVDPDILRWFDEELRKKAPILYDYIGCVNAYITFWRNTVVRSTWFEAIFCICFTFLLRLKLLFRRPDNVMVN